MRARKSLQFHMAGGPQPGAPVPAPGGGFAPPPAPVAAPLPPTIVRESQSQGFPVSAIPPMPAPPGQPSQPGQPAPVAPAPAPAAPAPAPTGANLHQVLEGEHVPPQLRGRTLGEALAQLNVLSRVVAGQQQPATPAAPAAPPAAPAPAAPGAPPAQNPSADFFRNPAQFIEQATERAVQRIVGPTLQAVGNDTAMRQATAARDQLVSEIGQERFKQLWPVMANYLSGASPQDLANPATWQFAARTAFGEMALRQPQQPAQPQQPQQPVYQPPYTPAAQPAPAGQFPVQVVGPNGQPVPNMNQFFSESPSPSQVAGRPQLTSLQEQARQGMNMTYEQFYAWSGGVQGGAR